MHELLPLNVNFYLKKKKKKKGTEYHILFNKFHFIDQIAIKKTNDNFCI